ncbi:FIP1[V]-like [Actinidia chinensis var. chinensis]|uniref:FIP1[V]-like n=1 Tax=Actinidia chinensis var. chinensis TaxID=1590841 RepID=A0A2R6R4U0_ACTCC|nr:FIP1[V]-like [Actinidia chinensis var. chinensis]
MEGDDEFGDLYTDVLRPFQSSSEPKQPSPNRRPIDLNIHSDDEEILYGAPNSNPKSNIGSSHPKQTLAFKPLKADSDRNLNLGSNRAFDFAEPSVSRVLDRGSFEDRNLVVESGIDSGVGVSDEIDDVLAQKDEGLVNKSENFGKFDVEEGDDGIGDMGLGPLISGISGVWERSFEDPNLMDESGIDDVVEESNEKDDILVQKDEVLVDKRENFGKFDVEEVGNGIGVMGSGPLIPGISGGSNTVDNGDEGDDWDSDSEDDLQIVLNDNNHGHMVMDRTGAMGNDDEDEDGDPLVIVADSEPAHQPMEEQEWGEDAAQVMDGDRKELGDAAKVNGGVAVAPKIGYNSHTYHPYHSQFKYVRPGAAPIPGAAPVGAGGAPGQLRPPVNMGSVSGRGRGDWRPMQKSFHAGFGMPGWGNNTSGRGLDFTLPSHKTIFEVDVDSFEEKPWKLPGIDISDFFNFSLNEDSWKDYCKQLEQLRLETTMQSKIRVYESGRTELAYDPDLPPELAAAAAIHDISSKNANLGKTDTGQNDVSKNTTRVRPPLPTGRAIQVETGYGERLPSIDTRPPRIRDSDAIIEIVLQDSADDDSLPGNEVTEQPENGPSREDFDEGHEIERDVADEDAERGFPRSYNGRKRELIGKPAPFMNSAQDNHTPKAPVQNSTNSRGKASAYPGRDFGTIHEERRTEGRAHHGSPNMTCVENTKGKVFLDKQNEDSVESIGGKNSPGLSSPLSSGGAEERDVEHGDGLHDELVLADGNSGMDREETTLDTNAIDTYTDENPLPSVKKQKLSSRVEQSFLPEIDDGGDSKAARSSESSKARSGSSRDHQNLRDSVDEEVVQHERSTHVGNLKRAHGEDEQTVRGKGRDERHEVEKHRLAEKNREGSSSRRDWDPYSANHLHGKPEGIDRRRERENSEGGWHRRDVDPHVIRNRAEDTKKRERGDEIGSRHRSKVRESERMDSDEHLQLRKLLDNGNLKGRHDKDVESRRGERDGNLKSRYENMDDLHSKRRKEEEFLRGEAEREEILHGRRENTSRSKRERDDGLDFRKRDDLVKTRDEDRHSVRHKEDGWTRRERDERPRERDELHRIKSSHEESLLQREREGGRGVVRSGRAAEDKSWTSHARVKEEYKSSDRDFQFKDTGRRTEQLERRDWVEDGRSLQHRGREDVHARRDQLGNDERRSRQERASAHSDRVFSGSDKNRVHEKNQKENTSKESVGGSQKSLGPSKRNHEDENGRINEPVKLKGTTERGNSKHEILLNRHSSKKHREDASSDDEQQDLKRGRSKLERWTSHKERDFNITAKSSSSLKVVKEIDKDNNEGSSIASKLPDESSKTDETIINQHPPGDEKDAGDPEIKNVDVKSLEDKHLDTVAKLKKRSERFKLPMPSEKEAMVIKKMESEPLPSDQTEACADSEVKPERPARKRRWISN